MVVSLAPIHRVCPVCHPFYINAAGPLAVLCVVQCVIHTHVVFIALNTIHCILHGYIYVHTYMGCAVIVILCCDFFSPNATHPNISIPCASGSHLVVGEPPAVGGDRGQTARLRGTRCLTII